MTKLFFYSLIFSALTSCIAVHHGSVSTTSMGKNVVFEDLAIGVSQSKKLFGLGGMKKDAMILKAKTNLYLSRPLKNDEEYVNFVLDFKKSYFFIFSKLKITMSADVIRHVDTHPEKMFSEIYLSKIATSEKPEKVRLHQIGDSIITKNLEVGHIISFEKKDKYRISYLNENKEIKTKLVTSEKIYNKKNNYNGYKINDTISLIHFIDNIEIKSLGIIKAMKENKLIIENQARKLEIIKYKDIVEEK